MQYQRWVMSFLALLATSRVSAQETQPVILVPEIRVGDFVANTPVLGTTGAATVVNKKEFQKKAATSIEQALQDVAGLNLRNEDGMGLRLNIGIRGLDPDRSKKILVMEDGVPIAMAPYGEPELYYSPMIERMDRLEIVKGSGSILYGPQTIGGVVNYVTPDAPKKLTIKGDTRAGSYGYRLGMASVGDTLGNVGYLVTGIFQSYDGYQNLNLKRFNINSKINWKITPNQSLSIKFDIYREASTATYLGLTTPQFDANPYTGFAKDDRFDIQRYAVQATHVASVGSNVIETKMYFHSLQRDWKRQDFQYRSQTNDLAHVRKIVDDHGRFVAPTTWLNHPNYLNTTNDGYVFFLDTATGHNRKFTVFGIEPRLTREFRFLGVDNELQAGIRFHGEHVSEQKVQFLDATASDSNVKSDDRRLLLAGAAYAQNRFIFFERKFEVTPGLRFESMWHRRVNQQGQFPTADAHLFAFIPGIGIAYAPIQTLSIFTGVHRGFSPPRTKDALTMQGTRIDLPAEYSWNVELGFRGRMKNYLMGEITGFGLFFSAETLQIAAATAGSLAKDGAVSTAIAGKTTHAGVESSIRLDAGKMLALEIDIPLSATYTFTHTEFGAGWDPAIRGNTLPYAPQHQASMGVGVAHPIGVSFNTNGRFVSAQFADQYNTPAGDLTGTKGKINAYFTLDAMLSYTHRTGLFSVFLSGKNLLDNQYIVSRAPQGIRSGAPRQFMGGISIAL